MKSYRRANSLIAYWDDGFVIENYLSGKQTAVAGVVVHLLSALTEPCTWEALLERFSKVPRAADLVEELIAQDVLVEVGSILDGKDRLLDVTWSWNHDARYFHFSTQKTLFQDPAEERRSLATLAQETVPPAVAKTCQGRAIPLEGNLETLEGEFGAPCGNAGQDERFGGRR